MGELALRGRDKLTLVCEGPLAPLGAWVEQLVAESTGKEGTGILPVDLEPLGAPDVYGDDRVFVAVRLEGRPDATADAALSRLRDAGHPVFEHGLDDEYGLGGEFLLYGAGGDKLSVDLPAESRSGGEDHH